MTPHRPRTDDDPERESTAVPTEDWTPVTAALAGDGPARLLPVEQRDELLEEFVASVRYVDRETGEEVIDPDLPPAHVDFQDDDLGEG